MVWKHSLIIDTDRWWAKYLSTPIDAGGPRIRDKGFPVWALISHYKLYQGDKAKVLHSYRDWLTGADLEAALAYYAEFPEDVDRKLRRLESRD